MASIIDTNDFITLIDGQTQEGNQVWGKNFLEKFTGTYIEWRMRISWLLSTLFTLGLSLATSAESLNLGLRQNFENSADVVDITAEGELDWWSFTDDLGTGPALQPSNQKNGGSGITSLELIGSVEGNVGPKTPVQTYVFTDGDPSVESSGTATAFDLINLGAEGAGSRLVATVSQAGTYELRLFSTLSGRGTLQATATLGSGATKSVTGFEQNGIIRYDFSVYVETDGADTITLELTRSGGVQTTQFSMECVTFSEAPLPEILRMYHIGNSLTRDSEPMLIADTLKANGYLVEQGFHIASGLPLRDIFLRPDDLPSSPVPPEPFGKWNEGLASYDWDVVTLQAYIGGIDAAIEFQATKDLINEALSEGRNEDCIFYLYHAWPKRVLEVSLAEQILETPFLSEDERVFLSNSFVDLWYLELREAFPNLDIRVVPTGEVLAQMDLSLRENAIGGFNSVYDLYRDDIHMNVTNGRHIAFLSMMSALARRDPNTFFYPQRALKDINLELSEEARNVAWSVHTANRRSGVVPALPLSFSIDRASEQADTLELTFEGLLYRSETLNDDWQPVLGARSPIEVTTTESPAAFFRVGE